MKWKEHAPAINWYVSCGKSCSSWTEKMPLTWFHRQYRWLLMLLLLLLVLLLLFYPLSFATRCGSNQSIQLPLSDLYSYSLFPIVCCLRAAASRPSVAATCLRCCLCGKMLRRKAVAKSTAISGSNYMQIC